MWEKGDEKRKITKKRISKGNKPRIKGQTRDRKMKEIKENTKERKERRQN